MKRKEAESGYPFIVLYITLFFLVATACSDSQVQLTPEMIFPGKEDFIVVQATLVRMKCPKWGASKFSADFCDEAIFKIDEPKKIPGVGSKNELKVFGLKLVKSQYEALRGHRFELTFTKSGDLIKCEKADN